MHHVTASITVDFPVIELGQGKIEVAEGRFRGKPALILGKNGSGIIGEETKSARYMAEGETLAVITFDNHHSMQLFSIMVNRLIENNPQA